MKTRFLIALAAVSTLSLALAALALALAAPIAAQDAPKAEVATPFFGAGYSLNRTGIPQDRTPWKYDGAGHMLDIRDEDRAR